MWTNRIVVFGAVALLAGCAVTPARFYEEPSEVKDTELCRAFEETEDSTYRADVQRELTRRGLTAEECQQKIVTENVFATVAGVAATAVAAGVICSSTDCSGFRGFSAPSRARDVDCENFSTQHQAQLFFIRSGPGDPHDLDRDNDGIACEHLP